MKRLLILGVGVAALVGCGEKETPPLTPDQLPASQVTKESNPPAGGPAFRRPEGNPNAKYQPRR